MPDDVAGGQVRNFKLTLEYDGTGFCGWQTQAKGLRTVQDHLEEKLARIFKKKVHCQASGRTDQGVHARGQAVHFKADTKLAVTIIHKALDTFLDRDLSVVKLTEVPLDFHAQKNVKSKTYRYTILNRPHRSALWSNRAYFYPKKLDIGAMQEAADILKGTHDFKSFQSKAKRSRIKNTERTIHKLTVARSGDFIHITITSDGFLYKMVRNITGVLIAVGNGRIPPESVLKFLRSKDRDSAPRTAPGHGLCLISVRY